MALSSRVRAACACENMICPVALLVTGIVTGITGCVVAAVGFGTRPKDMFDYANQAERISGLLMVGIAVLPVTLSVVCWIFYCSEKRANKKKKQLPPSSEYRQVQRPDEQLTSNSYPLPDVRSQPKAIYRPNYAPGDSGRQSSASDSLFSERYASQHRPSDAVRSDSSFEEFPLPPSHGNVTTKNKNLSVVDEDE